MTADSPENTDDDFLEAELASLGLAVPVSQGDPLQPRRSARRRTTGVRVVAGSALVAAGVVGGLSLTQESSPSVQVVATGSGTAVAVPESGVVFNQRTVDGVVNYAESSFITADGTLYMLSTAPGSSFLDGEFQPAQALYSTFNGETWTIADLGDQRLSGLSERDGLLYAISTVEGASGSISHALVSSSDAGLSWESSALPLTVERPVGPGFLDGDPFVQVDLEVTDAAFVGLVSMYHRVDYDWIYQELGLGGNDGHEPEFGETSIIVRDYSQCWAAETEETENSSTATTTVELSCQEPPIVNEVSYEELGIETPLTDDQSQFGLRSVDGVTWERVDVPGDQLSVAGDTFVSTEWAESGARTHVSTDGLTWTVADNTAQWRDIASSSLGGRMVSFGFEETAGDGSLSSDGQRFFFESSADGLTWDQTLIYQNEGPGWAWPLFSDVGPLGAVIVLQTNEDRPSDTYEQYISSLGHVILYSPDGVSWQTLQIEDPPFGEMTSAFMTANSIGVTFHNPGEGNLQTVLLTPER